MELGGRWAERKPKRASSKPRDLVLDVIPANIKRSGTKGKLRRLKPLDPLPRPTAEYRSPSPTELHEPKRKNGRSAFERPSSGGAKLPPIKGAIKRTSMDLPSSRTPPPVPPSFISESEMVATEDDARSRRSEETDGYATASEVVPTGKRAIRRIRVCVRKRPLPEDADPDEDCVLIRPPDAHISAAKLRVDLSEYMESHNYSFDDSFDCTQTNEDVYVACAKSLIDCVFEGGSASCFAYGQTGSGKTHTMIGSETEPGLYILAATDIFERAQPNHRIFVSLYEIYCNSLFDLLNHRAVVVPREDANKRVNVCGLTWHEITSVRDLIRVIDRGTVQRRTGSTSANEFSSRSHAVLTMTLRDENNSKFFGSLNVVDLAGSERAADTAGNDKQTRLEGAEINKSLLALKECIRGLDERKKHIPFRGSKLTEVLRDNFVGNSQTVMIATISARAVDVEHTLNTLRYAFRVKGLSVERVDPSTDRYRPPPKLEPLPPGPSLEGGKKKKKGKEKTKNKSLTPRNNRRRDSALEELERALEDRLQAKFSELAIAISKKDHHIDNLVEQNRRLLEQNEELRRLISYRDAALIVDE